jgi:hypothetical protein
VKTAREHGVVSRKHRAGRGRSDSFSPLDE